MEAHIKTMKELPDRLAAINAPIAKEDQVVTLLGSLPSSIGVTRGGHGRAFALPSLNFALPSKLSFLMYYI